MQSKSIVPVTGYPCQTLNNSGQPLRLPGVIFEFLAVNRCPDKPLDKKEGAWEAKQTKLSLVLDV